MSVYVNKASVHGLEKSWLKI